jgi:hypothetical protein
MVGAFLLMGMEMWAVTHDRGTQETIHGAELNWQRQQFQQGLAYLKSIKTGVQELPPVVGTEIAKLPRQTVVQSLPPNFGNLKERTMDLVSNIKQLVELRFKALKTSLVYSPPLTEDKMNEWNRSNNTAFRSSGQVDHAKKLRTEFAQFHLVDEQLNRLLDEDDRDLATATRAPPQAQSIGWMDPYNMTEIANGLARLASKLP